jgi:hypothetical protein
MPDKDKAEKDDCGCCRGRAIKYLTPLLIGGVVGYLVGARCGHKSMCPVSPTEVSAPVGNAMTPAGTPPK